MPWGKSKAPAYVPKTGAITLDRAHFCTVMRTRPVFREYSRYVGVVPAVQALNDAFTENLRCTASNGFWSYGTHANFGNPTVLRFADDAGLNMFMNVIDGLFDFDKTLMDKRATYLRGLKGEAGAGLLYTKLQANTELYRNYYVPVPPAAPVAGRPTTPPRTPQLIERDKARAWLKHGVQGSTAAFDQMFTRYAKYDGTFPFGGNITILRTVWQALVPHAPAYRGWNSSAGMQKYPSNIGGTKVLNDVLSSMATSPMPAQGSNAWYDLALYLLGAVITSQAFTDGNKRMSRFVYVLMLLSGGVPIVVPNSTLGAELGDM